MMNFNQNAEYDVICLGRSTVDIYSLDICELEYSSKFAKYLGGSPAILLWLYLNLKIKLVLLVKYQMMEWVDL